MARRDPAAYLRDKRAYWHRTLAELDLRPPPAGTRVLDAGCGPAGIFTILPDQRVTALDPLLPAYARDLPHFDPADYPNVTFVTGTLEDPPPLGDPFPLIYCFNAVNHVADWDAALDGLTALAAPGGRLVISSDVHRHALLYRIFRALPGDLLHPQQHRAAHYHAALRARGWVLECERVLRTERIFEYRAGVWRRSRHVL